MKQKKSRSLGKNAMLNMLKSGLSVFFPLITYPYAFRILHAENIGKIDYSASIISYFSLFALLGVSSYAVREGAKVRNNKEKFNKLANEIFSINVISTVCSYILLFICSIFVNKLHSYSNLIFLLSISIGFTTLGIDWINTIYEDYFFVTVRSILTHIISLILLFAFVRKQEDYLLYACLPVLNNIIISLSNWIYCKRYIRLKFTWKMNMNTHIKPILTLFANTIATSIYVSSDIIMLGWLAGDYFVGIYAIGVRIYNVLKGLMAAIYAVTIPRLSYYLGAGDNVNFKNTYSRLFSYITLILIPASAGIIAISKEIVIIVGGAEYLEAVLTLQILGVSLVGAIFGGLITCCLNVPLGREKINVKATVISAIINVILNLFMIPIFKQNGAAITTAISEIFVFAYCIFSFKELHNYLDMKYWITNLFHSSVGVTTIFIISFIVHKNSADIFLSIILIVIPSFSLYIFELFILRNQLVIDFFAKLLSGIKTKIN